MGIRFQGDELTRIIKSGIEKEFGVETASKFDYRLMEFYDVEGGDNYYDGGIELSMTSTPQVSDKEVIELQDSLEKAQFSLQEYKDFLAYKGIQFEKDWKNKPNAKV